MKFKAQTLENLLNLFLKSNCPLCQRPTSDEMCQICYKKIQKYHLPDPTILWRQSLPVFSWGAYGGELKRAIAVMKYENQPQIARPLGQWLGDSWLLNSPLLNQKLVLVPIPMHASKQKDRGYNQAALIAQSFCETTGLKCKSRGLERVQATKAQFGLSVTEREKNLAGAFRVGQDFCRRPSFPVLLVDDIYTTGATARSAIQTLSQAGIPVAGLVVIATTIKSN